MTKVTKHSMLLGFVVGVFGFTGVAYGAGLTVGSGDGCLDINMGDPTGSGNQGQNVIVWPDCHGGANQQWTIANGLLKSQAGGKNGCLDINMSDPTGSGNQGRNVIAWPDCHGGSNQNWTVK